MFWERERKWEGIGIGKSDKISEEHSSFSHHSQTSFSIRSLGQWAIAIGLVCESCMHVSQLDCCSIKTVQNFTERDNQIKNYDMREFS